MRLELADCRLGGSFFFHGSFLPLGIQQHAKHVVGLVPGQVQPNERGKKAVHDVDQPVGVRHVALPQHHHRQPGEGHRQVMPRPGIKQQQLDQHHQAEENVDLGRVADEVVVNAQQKDQQGEQAGQQPGAGYQMVGIVQAALSGPPQEKRRTRRQQQRYCAQWLKV